MISIDLKLGTTIDFTRDATPEQLTVPADIVMPLQDLILHQEDPGIYEYRSTIVLTDGTKIEDPPNQWRSTLSETLLITNSELPPLP